MEIATNSQTKRKPGRPVDETIRTRREEEILDAAAKLFARCGYSAANTQDLADILQVGKGTIYRYFPTKQDLFLAAVDRRMQQLQAAIDASLENLEDPLDRLAAAVKAYLTYFAEHPDTAELFIQERAQFKDRKKPTYFVYRDANRQRGRELFGELIAKGRVRGGPAESMLEVIGDLLYGTMFTNYFAGRNRSPEDQAADVLNVAFHGILSDPERRRQEQCGPDRGPEDRGAGDGNHR